VELWVIVAEVTDKLVRGVVAPTAPVNVVVPVPPAIVKACAPFTVLPNVTLALFDVIVEAPAKLTGLENVRGLAPESVILLPTWTSAALVTTRPVRGVVPPIAPPKDTTPAVPAVIVRVAAPLIVLVKLILAPAAVTPAFVLSSSVAPVMTTGPVIVITPPLVVTFPFKLIAVAPV
jgi:hypothetical protein